jgi:hypothetical protein
MTAEQRLVEKRFSRDCDIVRLRRVIDGAHHLVISSWLARLLGPSRPDVARGGGSDPGCWILSHMDHTGSAVLGPPSLGCADLECRGQHNSDDHRRDKEQQRQRI